MKIVIDTNVVASGVYFGEKPQKLLQCTIEKQFETFISKEISDEYTEIIERLSLKYPNRPKRLSLDSLVSSCSVVKPERKIEICRDPDDNKFLECAAEAKCLYVVSGDDDLLSLGQFEDIEIITVAEFFRRFSL